MIRRHQYDAASAGLWLSLAAAVAGCGQEPVEQLFGGPQVVVADSVVIIESDSSFLADVALIDVDASGAMLVADNFHKRVAQYGKGGELQASYGTKGQGPGEFLMLGVPLFLGDSLVAVADNRRRVINVFTRDSAFIRQVPSPGIVYDGVARADALWLGALDRRRGMGVARLDKSLDSVTQLVPMPPVYRESQRWAGMNTTVSIDEWRDTLFVGFSGDDALLITDQHGSTLQRLTIPRRVRLGLPDDIMAQIEDAAPGGGFDKYSALFSLHRLSDGSIGLVHFDQTLGPSGPHETVYLSVVSPDRMHACVDGLIPVFRQTQPAVRWKGDQLVLVEQAVVDSNRAVTIARTFDIRLDKCDWLPLP